MSLHSTWCEAYRDDWKPECFCEMIEKAVDIERKNKELHAMIAQAERARIVQLLHAAGENTAIHTIEKGTP